MNKEYNKLVRDKIPEIIINNGEEPIYHILNDEDYKKHLIEKFYEEIEEVKSSSGKDRLEELADLLEIIKCLAEIENSSLDEVIDIADDKSNKRGSFKDKIFLARVKK